MAIKTLGFEAEDKLKLRRSVSELGSCREGITPTTQCVEIFGCCDVREVVLILVLVRPLVENESRRRRGDSAAGAEAAMI